ncbi:amidohydrolase [Nonomuraea sp. NPDC050153]|uniref:amidohydrolase n=1 Tax=Nonomuraea sp. NPDC050153 TaxID=3364359 RepID=UPI00379F55A7
MHHPIDPRIDRRSLLQGGAAFAAAGLLPARTAHAAVARTDGGADLIIRNARVLVLDRRFRVAEAIAVRGGVVQALGRAKDVLRLAGRRTEVIDAGGGTVLPGINDSHLHLGGFGLDFPPLSYDVDTASVGEVVEIVRGAVQAATAPGSWIRGQGWNDNRLPRPPRASDLDPVSGEHPVVLSDFSRHAIAVNSIVLRLAGITRDTVPPTGGVIEKDADGEPTGVLRETAQDLVSRLIPPFTDEEVSQGIDNGIRILQSLGITSVTEPGISLQRLALYEKKAREGALGLRLTALLAGGTDPRQLRETLAAYRPIKGLDPRRLRVAGVKIFADGIPTAAKTAWLHEPYLDGSNGSLVIAGSTLREQIANLHELIAIAHARGFQVGTHATGDATIDAVVAGYVKALRGGRPGGDPRHYVIHGDLTPKATLRRMAERGIGVNMNATIKYLLGRTLDPVLGAARTDYQWPYRTALDLGVRVSSASDASVTFPSWLQGVQSAVLREGRFGGVAGEAERITVREALATYTRTPAWQDHADRWKGTLEVGMAADICVVGGEVLDADPHELINLPIDATMLGGEVVYRRTDSTAPASYARTASAWNARGTACLAGGNCCCRTAHA